MFIRVRNLSNGNSHTIQCDRVSLDGDEVNIYRDGKIVSVWGNGVGHCFYLMNDAGDTFDNWEGRVSDAKPRGDAASATAA